METTAVEEDKNMRLEKLEKVVRECGNLVSEIRRQKTDLKAETKDDEPGLNFSTVADRKSQELGLLRFREAFRNETVIAEEQKNAEEIPPNCIVFDPLDGTTNFFNGRDQYGVTACVMRDHAPFAGATYFPTTKTMISAVIGSGAYVNGKRVRRIPWHGDVEKMLVHTDIGPWSVSDGSFDAVHKPIALRFGVITAFSAIEACRSVLFGETAAYFALGATKIWDAAAMTLAINEAGGFVSAPDGSPLTWRTLHCDFVAAANREVAELVLEHTRRWAEKKKR